MPACKLRCWATVLHSNHKETWEFRTFECLGIGKSYAHWWWIPELQLSSEILDVVDEVAVFLCNYTLLYTFYKAWILPFCLLLPLELQGSLNWCQESSYPQWGDVAGFRDEHGKKHILANKKTLSFHDLSIYRCFINLHLPVNLPKFYKQSRITL